MNRREMERRIAELQWELWSGPGGRTYSQITRDMNDLITRSRACAGLESSPQPEPQRTQSRPS